MRHSLIAFCALAVLSLSAANAAPGPGASSHRLVGDGASNASEKSERASLLELIAALIGLERAPAAARDKQTNPTPGDIENCKEPQKALATAKPSTETTARTDVRSRFGEPLYLAF